MPETRDLAYRDRFVRYLIQVLSDRFDGVPEFPTLPFVDRTSRIPLVYRVNQDEYTQIHSAIMTGADLAFPDIAHELELIWSLPDHYEPEEDFCLDYETSDSSIITFEPQDPHTEPDVTPPGYLMPPFWIVGDVLPEFLPDWFAELITDIIEQFTGYEDDDVLTTIGSFPILGNWDTILTEGLPRFTINVEGAGRVQLHLLSVPLGGRLLVSVDIEFDIGDIIGGIIDEGFKLIELERDYSSSPPELDVDHIEEIVLEGSGAHVIYCTFLPVVDIDAVPLKFGGGIRSVTWCPDEIPDEECPECPEELTIPEIIADDTYFEEEYVPVVFGEYYAETVSHYEALLAAHDDTPQSVAPLVPVAAPGAIEDNALCYAVNRFVEAYSTQKTCLIQSQNFVQNILSDFANAMNDFYNAAANLMLPFYSPNIFSCFVDDTAAIAALTDSAAWEELACFLFDELSTVAMSQSNFDNAILDAATTLTGNAQDIACIMQNDNSESVYIAFLQSYNIALERQYAANEDLECPCLTDTYWMWVIDFATGENEFMPGLSSNLEQAIYGGAYWQNRSSNPPNNAWTSILRNFDRQYVIKAAAMEFSADGFTAAGSDQLNIATNVERNRAGSTVTITNVLGWATNGANQVRNGYVPLNVTATHSIIFNVLNGGAPSGSNYSRIHRVVIYGVPASGIKPPGSVWVSAVPVSPNPLFPV